MELRNEIKPLTEKKVYKRVRTEEQRQQNRNWQLRKAEEEARKKEHQCKDGKEKKRVAKLEA